MSSNPFAGALRLLQLEYVYGAVGELAEIYFDNIVLTETPGSYTFEFTASTLSSTPTTGADKWSFTPTSGDVGEHDLLIEVKSGSLVVGRARPKLRIANNRTFYKGSFCGVGDSLADGSGSWVDKVNGLLGQAQHIQGWTSVGTQSDTHAAPYAGTFYHEGFSGSHFNRFRNQFDGVPTPTVPDSPFCSAYQTLNMPAWQSAISARPEVIVFLLGQNDVYSTALAAIESKVLAAMADASDIVNALLAQFSGTNVVICVPPPGNADNAAFEANYGPGAGQRWAYKQKIHRFAEKVIEDFGGRAAERIHIVPAGVAIDSVNNYANALHPAAAGNLQLARPVYGHVCWRARPTPGAVWR